VDLQKVVFAGAPPQLGECFDEWHTLYVANRAAEFNDADIRLMAGFVDRDAGNAFYPVLDSICDVGHNLNGASEVVTPSFTLNDMLVDFARGYIVFTGQGDVEVTLVVSEIEVYLTTVVENEDFTMSGTNEKRKRQKSKQHTPWDS